ncbi:voltage-gated hydrogen channel 1 [Solanum pennellii]|uniref:Voltage-gated hydrogen channel 1 n=1 Tax=Solanum pennellii TaxID=28526 RepID=A0ABM1HLH6_SOLPN|nr:voltage-gated hydrogen channel 1 [Solanum pennellii]
MNTQEIQQSNPTQIQSVEISIQNLIKNWDKKQRWNFFIMNNPSQQQTKQQWRTNLTKFLESTPLRIFTIVLLIIDLVFTSLELSSSLISCPQNRNAINQETKEVWYHWAGIGILGLLFLKNVGLILGLGCAFFRRPGYLLDGIVVMVALFLEAYLEKNGGGLLVVVSLWRVVRVVESAFELSDEAMEAQIEEIVCQFEELKEENKRLMDSVVEKDKQIELLQQELDQYKKSTY